MTTTNLYKSMRSTKARVRSAKINVAVFLMLATSMLTACSAVDRVADIGKPPAMTQIEDPTQVKGYTPVSMPMPAPVPHTRQANSLWTGGDKGFFKDQRANTVGDILTVVIDINDKGEIDNKSERTRSATEGAGLNSLLGYEADLAQIFPDTVDNNSLVSGNSNSRTAGEGTIEREEKIEMKLAAVVTQVLPNGNMVISGNQEVRVNFEKRILQLAGIIRREDIDTENNISYDKIAEARIVYGGKGQITDVQQPRYGQQLYDVIFPF